MFLTLLVAFRRLLQRKGRGLLLVIGFSGLIATLALLRSTTQAWQAGAEGAQASRIIVRSELSYLVYLPISYADKLKSLPGVKRVSWATWFGGRDEQKENVFFATYAVDVPTFVDLYRSELTPPNLIEQMAANRRGAIVGQALAKKMGWKIGDRVRLVSGAFPTEDGTPWEFEIVGTYVPGASADDPSAFVFHWAYMNERTNAVMRDKVGWFIVEATSAQVADSLVRQVDATLANASYPTRSQDEVAFRRGTLGGIRALIRGLDLVFVGVLLLLCSIVGTTLSIAARQYSRQHAVLLALGFSRWRPIMMLATESAVLIAISTLLGLAFSAVFVNYVLAPALKGQIGGLFSSFAVGPSVVAWVAIPVFVTTMATSAWLCIRSLRGDLVETLRKAD